MMRVKPIRYGLYSAMRNKRQLQEIVHLSKLPYPDLLSELANQAAYKDSQGPGIHPRWWLHLSARHECDALLKIYSHHAQTSASKQVVGGSQASNIIQLGLYQLLNKPPIPQQESTDIMAYLSDVCKLATQQATNDRLMQVLAYGLPEVYPTMLLTPKDRRRVKQTYIQTLMQILPYLFSTDPSWPHVTNTTRVDRLLPMQLFNVSDQPLIKHIYQQYLYVHLPIQTHEHRMSAMIWLSRFGLEYDSYISSCLGLYRKQVGQCMKYSKQKQLLESINLCNSMFTVVRKIIGSSIINSRKGSHNRIAHISKSIMGESRDRQILRDVDQLVQQLPVVQIVTKSMAAMADQQIGKYVEYITSIIQSAMNESQTKIYNQQTRLLQLHRIKPETHSASACTRRIAQLKTLRYLLLLLHLAISQPQADNKQLQLVRQLFNNPQMEYLIANTAFMGDMLAELVYANQLYLAVCGVNLFNAEQLQSITKIRQQFCSYLDELMAGKRMDHDSRIMLRCNNVEYVLGGESRLAYHKSSMFNKGNEISPSIMQCLYNDNQFLCNWVTHSFKSLVGDGIAENVKLQVRHIDKSDYPYFPALAVANMQDRTTALSVYTIDNLCQHSRIKHTHPHTIVDCSAAQNIEEITKYFHRLPIS